MQPEQIRELLEHVKAGTAGIDEAFVRLAELPFCDLGDAKIDNHRALRCGFAEVVLCRGKEPRDVTRIIEEGMRSSPMMLATRAEKRHIDAIKERFPNAFVNLRGGTVRIGQPVRLKARGTVMVVTAGTGDIPIAEEALETLRAFGCDGYHCYDVGVAGLHRVLSALPTIREAAVVICVAGMDGALPSVLAGLIKAPVIAVPTSIGYGASFNGVAALLSMLNSCAGGVSVVNIDNGYGAAMTALRMVADRDCPMLEIPPQPVEITEVPKASEPVAAPVSDARIERLEKVIENLTALLMKQKEYSVPVSETVVKAPIDVSQTLPQVTVVETVPGVPAEKSDVVKPAARGRKTTAQPKKPVVKP
ncbi:MAG: nickel pincer cofactor biosynthesis protein LarB [Planctomycetota bacterium]